MEFHARRFLISILCVTSGSDIFRRGAAIALRIKLMDFHFLINFFRFFFFFLTNAFDRFRGPPVQSTDGVLTKASDINWCLKCIDTNRSRVE